MTTLVDLSQDITALKPGLIALRRELHQQPELAFEEVWTAATLAGRMRANLSFAQIEEIMADGLQTHLSNVQRLCGQAHNAIQQIYFDYPVESALAR